VNTLIAVRGVNSTYVNETLYSDFKVDDSGSSETYGNPGSGTHNKLSFYDTNKTEVVNLIEIELNALLC
jgi:hypothetical protein